MTLQERIYKACKESTDSHEKTILKIIVGELQRQPKKVLTDKEVVKILKQLIKSE